MATSTARRASPAPAEVMRSVNPATGEVRRTFPMHGPEVVEAALGQAEAAFHEHRRTSFAERAKILRAAADLLEGEKERWGELMSLEMGKTRASGVAEAEKCAWGCRYYAENAERFMADEPAPSPDGERRFVRFQPLGPVLAIMPWNFPFWQVFRFAAPAIMAGNVGLLKHASNVPECALAIEDVFTRAGAAPGVFKTLLVGSRDVGRVVADPRVRAVTLTGSEKAGMEVAATAGRSLKKVVLELGGSDPFIVMPSVDLEYTVHMATKARTINNGESCIAAKRFIVHASIAEAFEEKLARAMEVLTIGDPLDPGIDLGPLATEAIRDELHDQVERSVKAGARLLTGGHKMSGKGWFYAPTVLAGIEPHMPAWSEELFGPVALVFRAEDLDDALRIANDNPFGLGSSLWSADPAEQAKFVDEIDAGMAFVNAQVASDPSIPFGGVKRSGHGRELSHYGLREFTNAKTVVIAPAHGAARALGTE